MSKLIYIDTNVYIDFFENRSDRFRPFGEVARQILNRALDCEFKIVVSSLILKEIKNNGFENKFFELMNDLRRLNKVVDIKVFNSDRSYANELKVLRNSPFQDTCHAVVASRMNAEFLVTRNIKDFENLSDIMMVVLPEYI